MKKVLFIFIALLMLPAQKARFGAKIGLNSSTISNAVELAKDLTFKSATVYGLILSFDLNKKYQLDIEALSAKNLAEKSYALNELHVPLSARFNLLPAVYLRGGVQYTKLLSVVDKNEKDEKSTPKDSKKSTLKELFNEDGVSLIIGAGARINFPVLPTILVDLRYVSPLYNKMKGHTDNGNYRLSHFQLTLGVLF